MPNEWIRIPTQASALTDRLRHDRVNVVKIV